MQKGKKSEKQEPDKPVRMIDVLRGRVPVMENKALEVFYFLMILLFWAFVAWQISLLGLSIPFMSNLGHLFGKTPSS